MLGENKNNISDWKDQKPEVIFDDGFIECTCGCEGHHSYAVSTENGKIVDKGKFTDGFRMRTDKLEEGFYQLTIFDALKRNTYSFHVK